jgi:CDP-glucose 4,6-dehydratase
MAAQPLVRRSYLEPVETFETNVMGTVNVLEAAKSVNSLKAIVNVTTDKCYENREWVWGYREDEPMGGHDPYSSSKGCVELLSAAYRRSFLNEAGIALATARAGNVIGGGDWSTDRLLPDILRSIRNGDPVEIRNPNSTRPWQHVLEPLSGYLILAESLYGEDGLGFAEGWNFGPLDEDERSVEWIVNQMCNAWPHDASWTAQAGQHPHEANFLKLDTSKARQRLNWAPRWNIQTALVRTLDWHFAWIDGQNMRDVSLKQIREYQASNQKSA